MALAALSLAFVGCTSGSTPSTNGPLQTKALTHGAAPGLLSIAQACPLVGSSVGTAAMAGGKPTPVEAHTYVAGLEALRARVSPAVYPIIDRLATAGRAAYNTTSTTSQLTARKSFTVATAFAVTTCTQAGAKF